MQLIIRFSQIIKPAFRFTPFEQIKNEHYILNFQKKASVYNEEINAIVNNKQKPTFK